jgi:hypothetical protein
LRKASNDQTTGRNILNSPLLSERASLISYGSMQKNGEWRMLPEADVLVRGNNG